MGKLGQYLGLPPLVDAEVISSKTPNSLTISKALEKNLPSSEPNFKDTDADKDYTYARDNIYSIIEKGNGALEDILDVATQSQNPKAYEVLATTMKTLVTANKELVNLSKNKAEGKDQTQPKTVTNNLFVGTTHNLLKALIDMRNNGKSDT